MIDVVDGSLTKVFTGLLLAQAVHEGKVSDANWLPHMSCKAAGDVLRELMAAHPNARLDVLCGHTHGGGELEVLPNLHVSTGPARYGNPKLGRIIEVA